MALFDLSILGEVALVRLYPALLKELRLRRTIRSKIDVTDSGERMAIATNCAIPGLPCLQAAPAGTESLDAISRDGEHYSIRTPTSNTSGVFYGLPPKGSDAVSRQKCEHAVVVRFDDEYRRRGTREVTWVVCLEDKRWHSRMSAWNASLAS